MKDIFITRFLFYKELGEKNLNPLSQDQFFWKYHAESTSIATLVKDMLENIQLNRIYFLTKNDKEKLPHQNMKHSNDILSKKEMLEIWEKGWQILLETLHAINDKNWNDIIIINNEKHTILDIILRQLSHYSYHTGQIILIARMLNNGAGQISTISQTEENSSPVCYAKSDEIREDYKI